MLLVPLNKKHENVLTELAAEKTIWTYAPEPYYQPEIFKEKWLNKAITQMNVNERICFVISYDENVVGSSSYYEIDLPNKRATIGYTWFHPQVWGSKINTLSKLIMLEYAFETLQLNRVGFCVDSLNKRSCLALEKLGITREGILRNHMVLPDRIRHSVIYSVISDEWAVVKKSLEKILALYDRN
jgi:RimJ/RimL family protein N-acetyltransferase